MRVLLCSLGAAVIVAGLVAVVIWVRAASHRAALETIMEFEQRFPGRCAICSFHRYGLSTGATEGPIPWHRACPEQDPQPTNKTIAELLPAQRVEGEK